jgi:hypothetical protein
MSPTLESPVKVGVGLVNTIFSRDYEKPVDKDKDNVYKVTIIATDGDKNTTSKDLGVTVKNVFEFVSKTIQRNWQHRVHKTKKNKK